MAMAATKQLILATYLRENEITLQTTAVYTPAQDPAKRAGAVISATARTMRVASGLPQELWPEVVKAAMYLLNRAPVKEKGWKTPFELATGRKLRIGHLRVFGCCFKDFCLQNYILTLCMPAHTSHILQPLDVSCFGPLKKAYGSQIERKMRLGINHITKEEFLPAFFAAHQQAMTTETITSGFKATGLVPFNPERVLAELGPTIEATPSPRGSQLSWDPKTPKTLPEVKKQARLVFRPARVKGTLPQSQIKVRHLEV